MKKRTVILTLSSLLLAGSLFCQTPAAGRQPARLNLSLWKGVSTQPADTTGSTWLNLGIVSTLNRLNGAGINLLGSSVRSEAAGIQIGGIYNVAAGGMKGVQLAGIANVNGDHTTGLSLAGLTGITGNHAQGVLFAGLANIVGNDSRGLTLGGLANIAGDGLAGVQLAGLGNIAGGSLKGATVSGLLSVVGGSLKGLQLSGLAGIAGEDVSGIQLSGLGNVAGGTFRGLQLAPVNLTGRGKGLQIGLVNYYKEGFEGLQLGLVNANPHTRVQLMLFGGNRTKLNVGVRFKNRLFYTILGGGTHYLDFGDRFSAAAFYRAGLEIPLCHRLYLSGDLGYQHIETFRNKDLGLPARLYALQARANLEYRLTDRLGLFLTGGYGASRRYGHSGTFDKGLIVEGGAVLFKY